MTKIYEVLKKRKLRTIESTIKELSKLSGNQVKDLCRDISAAIRERDLSRVRPAEESPFNFTASPHAVGFKGPCIDWDCKQARADEFMRYAALYADVVALPDVFPHYAKSSDLSPSQLDMQKFALAGDIAVLWNLKPLIDAGIAAFVPSSVALCNECGKKLESTWDDMEEKLISAAQSAQRGIASQTQMVIIANEEGYNFTLRLPDELSESIQFSIDPAQPPAWLAKTSSYKTAVRNGQPVQLSPRYP